MTKKQTGQISGQEARSHTEPQPSLRNSLDRDQANHRATNVDTHTYIFVNDVITQSYTTTQSTWGLPASWNGVAPDYGMDPDVVNDPAYSNEIIHGLTQAGAFRRTVVTRSPVAIASRRAP